MRILKITIFALTFIITFSVFAQNENTKDTLNIPEVVVTSNRSSRSISEIPGQIDIIKSKTINELPVQNTDEILRYVSNVYVNRSWGIFSQNSSVTMRGLDASARVLVLIDGTPINKSSGGSVNWNLVPINMIDRVEVIKGPASAMYGNNAMAGVINIITKEPKKPFQGEIGIQGGNYGTYGGYIDLAGNNEKDNKGFSWSLNAMGREGDGYFLDPEDQRDSTSAKAFLKEANLSAKMGYRFSKNHKLEVDAIYYYDMKGQGRKVYEDDGDYMSVATTYLQAKYQGVFGKTVLNVMGFTQHEDEFKQTESVGSSSSKYKLADRDSDKNDYGLWINATTYLSKKNILTYGIDLKQGDVDVVNTYYTSTDVLKYKGTLDFAGIFLQDELKLANDKIIIVAGARLDYARYYNGSLDVNDPTSSTGFIAPYDEVYDDDSWYSFSPKVSVRYNFTDSKSVYISYSQGFMPPKLDDLSKSGKIRKGFKIANPELGPEYISNYEIGGVFDFGDNLTIETAIYYSLGDDFQYFVGTGDSVDTGGDDLKPVYQRQNISDVEIIGAEISTKYFITKQLNIAVNYSYNHSIIKEFKKPDDYEKDITGKYIIEVPQNMFFAGLSWQNKYFHTTLAYNYVSSQWYDDENTTKVDGYGVLDLMLTKTINKQFEISLSIQNILDNEYIDRKGYLAPGRFTIAEVKYRF